MIPPLVRRCPDCGHVGPAHDFDWVSTEPTVVVCPACHRRFEVIDDPRLL